MGTESHTRSMFSRLSGVGDFLVRFFPCLSSIMSSIIKTDNLYISKVYHASTPPLFLFTE